MVVPPVQLETNLGKNRVRHIVRRVIILHNIFPRDLDAAHFYRGRRRRRGGRPEGPRPGRRRPGVEEASGKEEATRALRGARGRRGAGGREGGGGGGRGKRGHGADTSAEAGGSDKRAHGCRVGVGRIFGPEKGKRKGDEDSRRGGGEGVKEE